MTAEKTPATANDNAVAMLLKMRGVAVNEITVFVQLLALVETRDIAPIVKALAVFRAAPAEQRAEIQERIAQQLGIRIRCGPHIIEHRAGSGPVLLGIGLCAKKDLNEAVVDFPLFSAMNLLLSFIVS